MNDTSPAELIEQVRSRYAQAARSVLNLHAPSDRGCSPSCCGTATDTAEAAAVTSGCCDTSSCCGGQYATGSAALDSADCFGGSLYGEGETDGLPEEAVLASLGCGNPLAVADLNEGERVLDLGSGGGIDVLLSARRVGSSGFAYGVDMTDDMLQQARQNAAKAGAANVEFRKGQIEALPLPGAAVDVVSPTA
jgi:arsenite methyltransferase